jgi:hypothetical protein
MGRYLAWQTGDTARIAASFETRGGATTLPRQAVEQATSRAFEAMAKIRPKLAKVMREVFEAHAPQARAAGLPLAPLVRNLILPAHVGHLVVAGREN